MNLRLFILISFLSYSLNNYAQFAPAAGQIGSTAVDKNNPTIQAWATSCVVQRGWQQVDNQQLGLATFGNDTAAIGSAGTRGIVSLGDGGSAILTFRKPIKDDTGFDFAIFENGFEDRYLELAFVEVSTDGQRFVRFPATSLTQTSTQTDGFGYTNPTDLNNLAGKYRVNYGTPFDLYELRDSVGIDIERINFVKIIDVVGSISAPYANYDAFGHAVNDPFPTPFASGGFDLDAVAVLHENSTPLATSTILPTKKIAVFPTIVTESTEIRLETPTTEALTMQVFDSQGSLIATKQIEKNNQYIGKIPVKQGVYYLYFQSDTYFFSTKIIAF